MAATNGPSSSRTSNIVHASRELKASDLALMVIIAFFEKILYFFQSEKLLVVVIFFDIMGTWPTFDRIRTRKRHRSTIGYPYISSNDILLI